MSEKQTIISQTDQPKPQVGISGLQDANKTPPPPPPPSSSGNTNGR